MSVIFSHRVLAVEIRAGRLGYTVFETPSKLRDFGAAWFDSNVTARSRIARLLRLNRPAMLVLRGFSKRYRQKSRQRRAVMRIASQEARKLTIPVTRINEETLRSHFERHSCRDKYDMARRLTVQFPEIAWRLPVRPKFYEPEPRSMLYFDSIALATTYVEFIIENGGILSPASK